MNQQAVSDANRTSEELGKYLTFSLQDEMYGLGILNVREIIGMMAITSIPHMPTFVKGVVNLRGRIIPVMDLRLRLGMPEAERTNFSMVVNEHGRRVCAARKPLCPICVITDLCPFPDKTT